MSDNSTIWGATLNSDPERYLWLFGLAPYPYPPAQRAEEQEAPAPEAEVNPEAEVQAEAPVQAPEGESGTEEEAEPAEDVAAGEQPGLEPYDLKSIAVPAKDEPAEADAEAGR